MGARSEREMAILDAALDLVTEVGFDCVSMDAIAARARASKATIYRHWDGKAAVVADAMRSRACVDTPPPATGSLRGDLLATVAVLAEAMAGADGRLVLGLLAASHRDPALSDLLREQLHEAKRPIWQAICDRAVRTGELGDSRPAVDALAEVIPGLAFLQHVVLGLPLDAAWQLHLIDARVLPLLEAVAPPVPQPAVAQLVIPQPA